MGPASSAPSPGRNAEQSWRGQKRSNETHRQHRPIPTPVWPASLSGQASILAYAGHVLMENRSGLVAQSCLTYATGTAERDAALVLVDRLPRRWRITLGADKGYDVTGFIANLRQRRVTPHIAADRRVSKTGNGAALGHGRAHGAPPGLRSSASASESGSRKCSAGSNPRPGFGRQSTAAESGSAGASIWPPPPTT